MSEEDRKDFGKIITDIQERRKQGQVQDQVASEAEEEAVAVAESAPTAQATSVQNQRGGRSKLKDSNLTTRWRHSTGAWTDLISL